MRGRAITLGAWWHIEAVPLPGGLKKFQTDELFAVMAAEGLTFSNATWTSVMQNLASLIHLPDHTLRFAKGSLLKTL